MTDVVIHRSAQAHLFDWYATVGFGVNGPGCDDDGTPHLPTEGRS